MKLPENVQKMDMAKAQMAAQPDNIMMLMMLVLPVATQALLPILAEFGFPQDQGGLMMFMSAPSSFMPCLSSCACPGTTPSKRMEPKTEVSRERPERLAIFARLALL